MWFRLLNAQAGESWDYSLGKRLRYILLQSNVDLVEFGLALYSTTWGLWLLLPASSLAGTPFALLRHFLSEEGIGAVILLVGISRLLGLLFQLQRVRIFTNLCALIFWLTVTFSAFQNSPASIALPTYAFIALGCALVHVRLADTHVT